MAEPRSKKSQKVDTLQKIKLAVETADKAREEGHFTAWGKHPHKPIKVNHDAPLAFLKSVYAPTESLRFNSNNETLNHVCVSFSKASCTQAQLRTLGNQQLDSIINSVMNVFSKLPGSKPLLPKTREEKVQAVALFSEENIYRGLEHGFTELNGDSKLIVKYFLNNIECFSGIKFIIDDHLYRSCEHHISICNSPDLRAQLKKAAYAVHAVDSELLGINVSESLLLIDNSKPVHNTEFIGHDYIINTIGHELLHTFGLAHPEYSSLEQQLRYRSLVADDEDLDISPLAKKCITNVGTGIKAMNKFLACLNPPVDLQPLDVKGLVTMWGESYNSSPYCTSLREDFIHGHQNVLITTDHDSYKVEI